MKELIFVTLFTFFGLLVFSQVPEKGKVETQALREETQKHRLDILEKKVDDLLWYERVGDIAFIDKIYLTGPPKTKITNSTETGAKNPVKFWCYLFVPKGIDLTKKYPVIILPHGGVHADFTTYYTHIVKELLWQGYLVVAPEYRGSTGYGKAFYELIDYGGLENEDVFAARNHIIENYVFADKNRVGIMGWSHGGMIALMNVFNYPDAYKVAFAGVPVSDLIARMGYATDDYRELFSAKYHIGKTPREDIEEYKKRSPAWNAHKLNTPLLIHTTTNDDDVYVLEVEHLIKSLKAEKKKFEYEIFTEAPGGHSFDRIDIKDAKEIRVKIYGFLAKYLNPQNPVKNITDINKAAYLPVK